MMKNRNKNRFAIFSVLFFALACFPFAAHCEVTYTAVVSTVAADYTSGAHSVISVEPIGGPRTVQNDLLPTVSDITVAANGKYFYRIERLNKDNVTKFDISAPDTPVWQYSTLDDGDDVSSNPYTLVFASEEKAYLIRYGKAKAWIVNPSAATEAEFKIGELNLSAYADSDNIPEMNNAVIANGKLYITLQRLHRETYSFIPQNDGYIAVFDTATDTEIDTGTTNPDGLKGIQLPIRNLGAILYLEENNMIYVQGVGDWYSSYSGRDPGYTGGVVSVNPDTYAVEMVVDDGDADDHPYGYISGLSIVSADKGYFVGYAGFGDNTLYMFNPSTGAVDGPANDALKGKNIAGMEAGTYADANDMLWVCDSTDARIVILNTADNSIDETISTNLNPSRVVFTTEGEAGSGDSGGGGGGGCFINTLSGGGWF